MKAGQCPVQRYWHKLLDMIQVRGLAVGLCLHPSSTPGCFAAVPLQLPCWLCSGLQAAGGSCDA